MGFTSVLGYAHQLVRERVQPGDRVIDATIGNGHDTVFLAELVGKRGAVYGFDIQEAAIAGTIAAFERRQAARDHVSLILDSHSNMAAHIPASEHGKIAAVMFNLGFLPGGDPSVITETASTLAALRQALSLLRPRGIITAVLYPGHPGGDVEAKHVEAWAAELSPAEAQVLLYRFANKPQVPYIVALEKRNHPHDSSS